MFEALMNSDFIRAFSMVYQIISNWGAATATCSAMSHALAYAIVGLTGLMVAGGFFAWFGFIREFLSSKWHASINTFKNRGSLNRKNAFEKFVEEVRSKQ